MDTIEQLIADIMADEQNATYTQQGIKPLFTVPKTARINIVGQAPGIRAQESGLYWNDPSGDNLRKWLGVDREIFYDSGLFAVVPMDYYFPGTGKSGDLPPRKGFAEKWHKRTLAFAPNIELHIFCWLLCTALLFATEIFCHVNRNGKTLSNLPTPIFPFSTPFASCNLWQARNPWFAKVS